MPDASPPSPAAAPAPPIQFREFDAEQVARELEAAAPAMKAAIESYERAKHVSQRTLQMCMGEPLEKDYTRNSAPLSPPRMETRMSETQEEKWAKIFVSRDELVAMTDAAPEGSRLRVALSGYRLLRDAVNETNDEHLPECSSYGHAENCPAQDQARWLTDQQATIRDARVRITELESLLAEQDAQLAQMREDAARYRWLREVMQSAKGGASVEVNPHLAYYEEAEPGEECRVQWYPDTPIGFYATNGATLDEAVDNAMRATWRQNDEVRAPASDGERTP